DADESLYDTESEILFVKSFQASQITQTKADITKEAEDTLMGSKPMDMDCEFNLESMPDDDLQSLTSQGSDSQHVEDTEVLADTTI
ncbi:hypothetical protein Tco_1095883, partial [Tanacetum coccineum]